MLIPWGHDSSQLRRRPWVTYGMAIACAVAFLASAGVQDPDWEEAEARLDEAFDYWEAHPYLKGNDRLIRAYWELDEDDYAHWEEETGGLLPGIFTIEAEQARLDAITAQARDLLDSHPWYRFGLIPAKPSAAGLFGHMFLHSGLLHLIGNLWFLILAGPYIEDRWGRALFSVFYLASGVAGAVLFAAAQPSFDFPLVGASGAVSGILGAFLVCCMRVRIKFFYWIIWPGTFSAPAWAMLPLWFGNELVSAFSLGEGSAVAYWAHVGGFLFGAAAALAIRHVGLEGKLSSDLGELDKETGDPVLDGTRRAIQEGRMEEAIAQASQALADRRADPVAVKAYLEAVHAAGREQDVGQTLVEHLWSAIQWRKKEAAIALWEALAAQGMAPSGAGEPLLQLAGWLRGTGNGSQANVAMQRALVGADGPLAVRIARAARKHDPALVKRAAEVAIASAETTDADRKAMQALLEEAGREARRRGWILLPLGERVEKGRGRDGPRRYAPGEAIPIDDAPACDYEDEILGGGSDASQRGTGAPADAGDPFDARETTVEMQAPARTGQRPETTPLEDETINLSPSLGGNEQPPLSLPDPETEGGEVFLESLHAQLGSEWISEEDPLAATETELTDEPSPPDLGSSEQGRELFDHGNEDLGGGYEMAGAAESIAAAPPVAGPGVPAPLARIALPAMPAEAVNTSDDLLVLDEEKEELPRPRRLRVATAVPLGLDATHLALDIEGRGRSRLALERIDAVSAAGINGLSGAGKPVLVIDLCLNWTGHDDLQLVRLRSDSFDPRKLVDAEGSLLKALRAFAALLATRCHCVALPADFAPDAPFRIFADTAAYELEVLRAIR